MVAHKKKIESAFENTFVVGSTLVETCASRHKTEPARKIRVSITGTIQTAPFFENMKRMHISKHRKSSTTDKSEYMKSNIFFLHNLLNNMI